ncbi:MAG: DUF2849 domain-containing protein [Pseudomonadota bacterium]
MAQPIRSRTFLPRIVSANDLLDGDVVYFEGDGDAGEWTRHLARATVADTPEAADALLARAAAQPHRVVGPALAEVERTESGPRPLHYREVTRATGPTTRPDLGRISELS